MSTEESNIGHAFLQQLFHVAAIILVSAGMPILRRAPNRLAERTGNLGVLIEKSLPLRSRNLRVLFYDCSYSGVAMVTVSSLVEIASLAGDVARAQMLAALMDGRALTATELAKVANITPQTASGHLAKLSDAGLVAVEPQGRHRYHRLASPAVAHMLESIMSLAADLESPAKARRRARVQTGPRDSAMRYARTCYDHLAGELAVAITDSLTAAGHVELSPEGGIVTPTGMAFFRDMGIELQAGQSNSSRSRRVFCRPCLDWSERRPHLAGTVGTALCKCCLERGWLRRMNGTRAISVTPSGRQALTDLFHLSPFSRSESRP